MSTSACVLLFDSDGARRGALAEALRAEGLEVREHSTPSAAPDPPPRAEALVADAGLLGQLEVRGLIAQQPGPLVVALAGRRPPGGPDIDIAFGAETPPAAIAKAITALLRGRRAERQAERLVERMAILKALAAALSTALTPEQVAAVIFEKAVAALGARGATLSLARGPDELGFVGTYGYPREVTEQYRRYHADRVLPYIDAFRSGEPVWLESREAIATRYPHLMQIAEALGDRAWAALPLRHEGESFGVLGLSFREARAFEADERDFAATVADACSQALERARLLRSQELLRASAQANAADVRRSGSALGALLDALPAAVVRASAGGELTFLNQAARALRRDRGRLALRGEDGGPLAAEQDPIHAALGRGEPTAPTAVRIERRDGTQTSALATAAPVRDESGRIAGAVAVFQDVSQQLRAERQARELTEALEAQRRLLDSVLGAAPAGIAIFNAETLRLRWANPAYRQFFDAARRSDEQIIGRHVDELLGAGNPVADLIRRAARTGEALSDPEYRYEGFGEGPTWWSSSLLPLPQVPGAPEVVLMAVNITDAVLARERLEEQRARLRAVIAALPVGVVLADARGGLIEANEMAARIWGGRLPLASDNPDYARFRGWFADTGRPVRAEEWPLARTLATGDTILGDIVDIERFDGARGTILTGAAPLRDAEGEIDGAVVIIQDVTEARRAEEDRLRLLERVERHAGQLSAVMDAMADALVVFGPRGEIEYLNDRARRLFDPDLGGPARPDEAWLRDRVRTADGQPLAPEATPLQRALRGETVRGLTLQLAGAEGRGRRWLSASAAPIRDEHGGVRGAVATLVDVTALHELRERQEDLLRTISHDLRTPLSTIQLQAQMLQRDAGNEEKVRRRGQSLLTSAQRMNVMISELVDMGRLEAGLLKLQRRPVELGPFLHELHERLAGTLPMARVHVEVDPGVPAVNADPPRLERIVVNLVTNALKYSPPESDVTVSARATDDGVELAVADHGPGIAPEELPKLFQRFYRADGGAQRAEGTGLGLYITRLLAEAHGGRVAVDSEVGRGSVFRALLPAAATAVADAPAPP